MKKRFLSLLLFLELFLLLFSPISINATETKVEPMVVGSEYHTVLLKTDGTVWAWGNNQWGQLGDGTNNDSLVPVKSDINNVVKIAAASCPDGSYSNAATYALKSDGTVWAWGRNQKGQLGVGNYNNYNKPVKVNISDVIDIKAGHDFAMAVKKDGTVWYWGNTFYFSSMGLSATTVPIKLDSINDVKEIQLGTYHIVYLKNDNSIWTQGWNYYGQLGIGNMEDKSYPVKATDINGGFLCDTSTSCVSAYIDSDGYLYGCGVNRHTISNENLKSMWNGYYEPYFIKIHNKKYKFASLSWDYCLSIDDENRLETWGKNVYGGLGQGNYDDFETYQGTIILNNVKTAYAGSFFSVAITNTGDVYSWGRNNYGQLGNGTVFDSCSPVKININAGFSGNGKQSSSTSDSAPIIKSAELEYNNCCYDILTQKVTVDTNSLHSANLTVKIDWHLTKNKKVLLSQGVSVKNKLTAEFDSSTGKFTGIDFSELKPNLPVYIIACDELTGATSSVLTKLNIVDASNDDTLKKVSESDGKFQFSLGSDTSFTVPDEVPILAGTKIKWDTDWLPVSVECESPDKMNVVIGIDVATVKSEKDSKTGKVKDTLEKFKDFDFDEYKKIVKNYSKENRTLKQLKGDFSRSNKCKSSLFDGKVLLGGKGGTSYDFEVCGYATLEKNSSGKWNIAESNIKANIEIKYTYNGQVFIYVIPCYYTFGGNVGANIKGGFTNADINGFKPVFFGEYGLNAGLTVGAGFGVNGVAKFGISGDGGLVLTVGNQADIGQYFRAEVEASVKMSLELLGKEIASNELWKHPEKYKLIYSTHPDDKGKTFIDRLSGKASLMSVFNDYDINNVYHNESRDYLNKASSWLGNSQKFMLMSAEYTNKNLNTLAENIYPNSEPQICDMNGTKVLIFTEDNSERTANNRQMLVYSVYDELSDTWSIPKAVCDDGTADFYPSVAGDYIVWQNQKSVMADNMTLADIGKQGEIVIAKWNGNGFDTPTTITNNNELDTLPKIAVKNDEITVSWIKNDANDILGISGKSSIIKKIYNGTSWSNEQIVKQNLNSIIDMSLGYDGDKLYLAYIPDSDGDISTLDDREVYLIGDSETKITDNEFLDSRPIIDNGKLYWYSENNIYYRDLDGTETKSVFEEGKYQLAEGFTVSENNENIAILWSGIKDDANEIMGVLYQNDEWGDVITVSELGGKAKNPTAVLDENGRMLTAFTSEIEESTNLYTIDLTPSYDIAVEDVYFNESGLAENISNEFEVTVKNNGELPIESYTISVYNEDETLNKTTEITESIKSGETKTVTASFNTSDTINLETLTVKAEITDDEYNVLNNEKSFEIGHSDVELFNFASYELLPTSTVVATIKNSGFSNAENITINLRNATEDGEIIDSKTITSLASDEAREIVFDYEPKKYDNTQWYITVETESEEISKGNNSDYFINECSLNLNNFEHSILNYLYSENVLTVNSYAVNNTENEISGTVYVAVYGSDKKLKKISVQDFTLPAYSDTGVDVWVENYEQEEGDTVKIFAWNGLIPLSTSYYIN